MVMAIVDSCVEGGGIGVKKGRQVKRGKGGGLQRNQDTHEGSPLEHTKKKGVKIERKTKNST